MTHGRADSASLLGRALHVLEQMEVRLAEAERAKNEAIAIVGIACRLPGGGIDPETFWRKLRDGTNGIRSTIPERWTASAAPHPAAHWAGLLDGVDQFDAEFFGLPPAEASAMDPQQRVLLEVAWEALEDATIPAASLEGSRTGVYVGITLHDYERLSSAASDEPEGLLATGTAVPLAAGRISHLLDLRGPSLCIDTACSSALAAVHAACRALRDGECDLALAGGVNLILDPRGSNLLSSLQILSSEGKCRTFDAAADGYVRSEGCGIVVLRRLSDALRQRDPIRAIVRGSAVVHNGRAQSPTAPSVSAQVMALRLALGEARVAPTRVGYVEMHSNGSPLGDAIEAEALRAVLGAARPDRSTCVLGSLKTNIGHAEAASGVAGLVKAVLALEHEAIPPNLHFEKLNPRISLTDTPFTIPVAEVPWKRGESPRIAGVSASGLSGTNVHVVVEEAPAPRRDERPLRAQTNLLPLSARTSAALRASAERLRAHLAEHPDIRVDDACYTAAVGRNHFEHRLALLVGSPDKLLDDLAVVAAGGIPRDASSGVAPRSTRKPRIGFSCPHQRSVAAHVGRALYEKEPVFRQAVVTCEEALRARLGRDVAPTFTQNGEESTSPPGQRCFVLQYAVAQLLRSWGVYPSASLGEGSGEVLAAHLAGILRLEEAISLLLAWENAVPLEETIEPIRFEPPRTALHLASRPDGLPADLEGWRAWARAGTPVRASGAAIDARDFTAILELGPQPAPSNTDVPRSPFLPSAVASLQEGRPDADVLLSALGLLYTRGVALDWQNIHQGYDLCRVRLPTYPFDRKRFWLRAPANRTNAETPFSEGQSLLGRPLVPFAHQPLLRGFERTLDAAAIDGLGRHHLAFVDVLSLGALASLARSAGDDDRPLRLAVERLVLAEDGGVLQTHVEPAEGGATLIRFYHRSHAGAPFLRIATGTLAAKKAALPAPAHEPPRFDDLVEIPASLVRRRLARNGLSPRGFHYERVGAAERSSLARIIITETNPGAIARDLVHAAIALASSTHRAATGVPWSARSFDHLQHGANITSATWLRLVWTRLDTEEATVDGVWLDTDGTTIAEIRGLALTAAHPFDILRESGKDPAPRILHERTWIARPLTEPAETAPKRHGLILADRSGLAQAAREHWLARGHACTIFTRDELEQAPERLDVVLALNRSITDVIHLWSLDAMHAEAPLEAWMRVLVTTRNLATIASSHERPPRFWFVTRGAEAISGPPGSLGAAALLGLGRALALETPGLWGGSIDLDPEPSPADVEHLTQALAQDDHEDRMAFRGGTRLCTRLSRLRAPLSDNPLSLRPEGTYLVTGGLGWLGLCATRWLVERGARSLVLVDSSRQKDAQLPVDTLRAIEALGARICVESADACDRHAMQSLLARLDAPLAGVVHADHGWAERYSPLDPSAAQAFETLVRRSALAGVVLDELTQDPSIEFVLLSTASSLGGAKGSAYEVLAEEIADALAFLRRSKGLRAHSVHAVPPGDAAAAWDEGLAPLSGDALRAALDRSMGQSGLVAATAVGMDAEQGEIDGSSDARRRGTEFLLDRLPRAGAQAGRRLLTTFVREQVAHLLGHELDAVAIDAPFDSLGLGSIAGVQLAAALGRALGVPLPASVTLEHASVSALAEHLASRLLPSPHAREAAGLSRPWAYSPLLPLRSTGRQEPFFCVHPGYGMALVFKTLAVHLGPDQPFFGLQARGVDLDEPPIDRIEEMAALYVQAVRSVKPRGPYKIGGYSFGAYVAYEMAQQLTKEGEEVERLVLIDIPAAVAGREGSLLELLAVWLGYTDDPMFSSLGPDEQARHIARAVATSAMLPDDVSESNRLQAVVAAHNAALRTYRLKPWSGRITLIRSRGTVAGGLAQSLEGLGQAYGWDALSPYPVDIHDTTGTHFNLIFEPYVRELSAILRRILAEPARAEPPA
ncbi:type I polyketide synthase [Polyangium sorediatum]|uniref:Type I polyketide synthase n=1 Tax=Polyangium sorediatum TaxID=889274 RepID=A0ABT6NUC0_9BACT|nr:type I polyketide synthase [Polyangium sorediatum]MDI1431903.1 type I polyketide synthase [Polyangium sorediatum]